MALHSPPIEKMEDAFAVAQLNRELKIVGIKATFDEATELCEQTSNLGYPVVILAVPLAFMPQRTRFPEPCYK